MNEQEKLAIKASIEDRLFRIPGVHMVGLGCKRVDGGYGGYSGGFAIRVYVTDKKALRRLSRSERIPSHFDGLPTDVIECPRQQLLGSPSYDSKQYDAHVGGVGISGEIQDWLTLGGDIFDFGTLGCIVMTNDSTPKVGLLTAYHTVISVSTETVNSPLAEIESPRKVFVGQPIPDAGFSKACCDRYSSEIVLKAHFTGELDAAVVELRAGEHYRGEILELGPGSANIFPTDSYLPSESEFPYPVRKRGAMSRVTNGVVTDIHATGRAQVRGVDVRRFVEHVHVEAPPATPGAIINLPQDSGAVWFDSQDRAIGLITSGAGTTSTACRFTTIESKLGVTIYKPGQLGLDRVAPAVTTEVGAEPIGAAERVLRPMEARVLAELEASPAGRQYVELTKRHSEEIGRIVNHDRRAMVRWHRLGGPQITRSAMRTAYMRKQPLPREVHGRSWRSTIEEASALLQEHGSDRLRADLRRYAPALGELGGMDFEEILNTLDRRGDAASSSEGR